MKKFHVSFFCVWKSSGAALTKIKTFHGLEGFFMLNGLLYVLLSLLMFLVHNLQGLVPGDQPLCSS
ncbi:putative membrane protein [Bacillus methanolicus MGA3]|uniref:Putative membrane protein n=1 Tax=Bacillus methanolicus (strain MGA3 / ATCC 53907) TaxID=796606 RepID=A0A068LVE2_BACMM|nr:putative membrane protein [Bacillus methanolicus MGA3]